MQLLRPMFGTHANRAVLMLTPDDIPGFRSHRGFDTIERLQRRGGDIRVHQFAFGDHSLHGPRIRAAVRTELRREIGATFPATEPVTPRPESVPVGRAR